MYDALVLGGGVAGLATVEALTRRGLQRVGLIERFELGHGHGSSHGRARIARGAYHDSLFARLFGEARDVDWPRLERSAAETLLYPSPGCIFGPREGQLPVYEAACRAAGPVGESIERLELSTAREAFPDFRFPDHYAILRDNSSCVIAAADTIVSLQRLARQQGAELLEHTRCQTIERAQHSIRLHTDRALIETQRLIVTAGAWTAALLTELAPSLKPVQQTVAFFELDLPPSATAVGHFPVWIHLGEAEGQVHYGMPQFQCAGLKVARHRAHSNHHAGDDPEPREPDESEQARELEALRTWFAPLLIPAITGIASSERCLYTLTSNEDFKLGRLPADERITVGAGLSGHGFKFAPLLGRILSELALDGRTSSPVFEAERSRFAI